MEKKSAVSTEKSSFKDGFSGLSKEAGKIIVPLSNAFAAKVSCDVFKYLSMKEFQTYFIDRWDATSFRALHCKPLSFSVAVRVDAVEDDVHVVDFFLNDRARHNPLIYTGEQVWVLLHNGDEVGKIEPLLSVREEMKVRGMAGSAFKALRCAFRKKAGAELCSFHFHFGRPMSGHWAGKLVITGAITGNECRVTWSGSTKNLERSDFHLSMLTEKLFS